MVEEKCIELQGLNFQNFAVPCNFYKNIIQEKFEYEIHPTSI